MMGIRLLVFGAVIVAAACGPKVLDGEPPDSATEVPVCDPGATELCYNGPAGSEGVGPCKGGSRTCSVIGQWGPCDGEILPAGEACNNGVDENCNGMVDEDQDLDADGFTTCGGDCCDSTNDGCASPTLINPGAFEAAGNNLDDDCDGIADNIVAANCDSGLASGTGAAADYAAAMDICQTTTAGETKWGLLSAQLVLADGTGAPNANQHAIRPAFGSTAVQSGSALAVLSTGHASAPGQTNPAFLNFQTSDGLGGTSGFPSDFLTFHNNTLPNVAGCPDPDATAANDPIMLQLEVRAPTNAKSFSFSMNFMSSEYPEWTCSAFNDFFVVLLDSTFAGMPANPADKNLAIYTSAANQVFPVGVNLAVGNTGLFQQCVNGPTGCGNPAVPGNYTACSNTTELANTGMETPNPGPNPLVGGAGSCGASNLLGGGTGWLTTSGNVVGGEVITLRIAIWDTSDGLYDSIALIDNFQWSVEASEPGTVLQKPKH